MENLLPVEIIRTFAVVPCCTVAGLICLIAYVKLWMYR